MTNPNAANRKDIRQLEKQAKVDAAARAEVLTQLMKSTAGRAYIWDLLTQCQCFATTFTPEPAVSAFNEGRRSVGLAILSDIMSACPDSYITAAREANARSAVSERRVSEGFSRDDSGSGGERLGDDGDDNVDRYSDAGAAFDCADRDLNGAYA